MNLLVIMIRSIGVQINTSGSPGRTIGGHKEIHIEYSPKLQYFNTIIHLKLGILFDHFELIILGGYDSILKIIVEFRVNKKSCCLKVLGITFWGFSFR